MKLDYKQSLHNFKKFPIMLPQYEFLSLFLPYLGKKKAKTLFKYTPTPHTYTQKWRPWTEERSFSVWNSIWFCFMSVRFFYFPSILFKSIATFHLKIHLYFKPLQIFKCITLWKLSKVTNFLFSQRNR